MRCALSKKLQEEERERCKEDIIHFAEQWCFLVNPLYEAPYDKIPFLMFEYQKELVLFLRSKLVSCNKMVGYERANIAIPKCRETAGSWSGCLVTVHDWLFWYGNHLWLSRKEEEVDQDGNMDTPFQKMKSLIRWLPEWLQPEGWDWKKHSNLRLLKNPVGGNVIEGEAMSGNAGAGGRKKCVWFDEFARTLPNMDYMAWRSCSLTSNMRVAICTPEGPNNKFAKLSRGEENEACYVIRLHWWKDPRKMQHGEVIAGVATSPWYLECVRTMDAQTLASQVNMSFEDSVKGRVFEAFSIITHATQLVPMPGVPLIIGLDPGACFAVSYNQLKPCQCYRTFRTQYWESADIDVVGRTILSTINQIYPGFQVNYCGDPAGVQVGNAQQKGRSTWMYFAQEFKIQVHFRFMYAIPRTNWLDTRLEAARTKMGKFCTVCKQPQYMVDEKHAEPLAKAFEGRYRYKVIAGSGETTGIIAEEHPWEDYVDSALYPLLFTGQFVPQSKESKIRVPSAPVPWGLPSQQQGYRR